MVEYTPDDFLAHYGRVGMKWGRRGRSAQAHGANLLRKASSSEDHNAAQELKGKKLHTLSNAQIKTLNSRMQLELAYKSLNAKPPTKGERFVKGLLKHSAMAQSVFALANSPMVKAGINVLGPSYAPRHSKGVKAAAKVNTSVSAKVLTDYAAKHRK